MKIPVLDYGYVRFVEAWGHGDAGIDLREAITVSNDNECGIIEAARQSTQGSFRGWDQDAKLLEFLYNNKHATPFEFAGMIIEVQAPIFVFREWHRHRTQSYNEMSARYSPLPHLYYTPTEERVMLDGGKNKQAQGSRPIDLPNAATFIAQLAASYRECESTYSWALSVGVPKELARCIIPVGHYSRMRASTNLRNWLAFLTLRQDPAAQWEIRQFANAVSQLITEKFPRTAKLFSGVQTDE